MKIKVLWLRDPVQDPRNKVSQTAFVPNEDVEVTVADPDVFLLSAFLVEFAESSQLLLIPTTNVKAALVER